MDTKGLVYDRVKLKNTAQSVQHRSRKFDPDNITARDMHRYNQEMNIKKLQEEKQLSIAKLEMKER